MADTKQVAKKANGKKFNKKFGKKQQPDRVPGGPVEVLYDDPITKQKVVAVYKHESKWWFGTRLYKLYHPLFKDQVGEDGYRWVMHISRTLGPAAEDDAVVALAQETEEKEVAV